jgi:hypothetical protein
MKTYPLIALLAAVLFFPVPLKAAVHGDEVAYTGEEKPAGVPEGMEELKVNDVKLIVPKGTQIKKPKGNWVQLETLDAYLGREVSRLEKRLDQLEEEQRKLQMEIDELESPSAKSLTTPAK